MLEAWLRPPAAPARRQRQLINDAPIIVAKASRAGEPDRSRKGGAEVVERLGDDGREGIVWKAGKQLPLAKLQRIGANGEAFVGAPQSAPCAANDVTVADGSVLTTFDHSYCGIGGGLEDVNS